jgi:hypothetical protein
METNVHTIHYSVHVLVGSCVVVYFSLISQIAKLPLTSLPTNNNGVAVRLSLAGINTKLSGAKSPIVK